MTIANRLKQYLEDQGIGYDTVAHRRTMTTSDSAHAAHISGEHLAKSVVVHHESGYVLAVVPSTHRIELGALQKLLGKRLGLATEAEIAELFEDCDLGAMPPIGAAYDLEAIVDESIFGLPEVYFEGGDHRTLVHVTGDAFQALLGDARRARFSHHG